MAKKSQKLKVKFLTTENWIAMYINGKKVQENHSLNEIEIVEEISRFVNIEVSSEEVSESFMQKNEWSMPDEIE